MDCSRPWIMRTKQLSTLVILIQLWQTTSGAVPAVAGLLSVESGQDKEIRLPSEGIETDQQYHVVFHVTTSAPEIRHLTIYYGTLDRQPEQPFENRFTGRFRVTSYVSGRPLAFILKNITEADAGLYSCQTDREVEIPGCENLLVVVRQPSQPSIPPPREHLSSSNVSLSCNSTSRSLPAGHPLNMSSVWRRNNITVDDMDRPNVEGLKVEGLELSITNIPAGYNGDRFSCQTSEDGLTSRWSEEVQLNILGGPNKILFNDAADTVLAVENTPIALRCSVECLPACSVTWNTTRWGPATGLGEAVLSIQNVDRSMSGLYRCDVNNTYGQMSRKLHLVVQSRNSVAIPVAVTTCTLAVVVAVVTGISICSYRNRQVKNKLRYAAYLTTVGNRASLSSTDSHYATVDAGNLPQPRDDSVTDNDYQGLEEVERFHIYTALYPPLHRGRNKCNIM